MYGEEERNALNDKANDCLLEVSRLIRDFLLCNGGLDNGYETWMEGTVCKNTHSHMVWRTPKCRDLTQGMLVDTGVIVYEAILKVINSYDIETLEVSHSHVEYGCHNTSVSFPNSFRVSLSL